MVKKVKANSSGTTKKMRPALTPEARENQLISLATDLAEEQLRNGTASSQVISHFLRLGSTREQIENEMKVAQRDLLNQKTESLKSAQQVEEMYKEALNAMRHYSGQGAMEDD